MLPALGLIASGKSYKVSPLGLCFYAAQSIRNLLRTWTTGFVYHITERSRAGPEDMQADKHMITFKRTDLTVRVDHSTVLRSLASFSCFAYVTLISPERVQTLDTTDYLVIKV